jgi:hypothetical protein
MTYVPPVAQADAFMLIDFKRLLAADETPETAAEVEWLLTTATGLVEREAARLGLSEWELFQHRHEVESIRVQRALDVLDAGGFLLPDAD